MRIFLVIASGLLTFLRALALYLLWMWFVVPLGAPTITMFHSMGLALIPLLFLPDLLDNDSIENRFRATEYISKQLATILSIIFSGWLFKLVMSAM
jgi:hypothetical protein